MIKNKDFMLQVVAGAAAGAMGAYLGVQFLPELNGFPDLLLLVAGLVLGIFLQIIVHELGHLICGLLSGYKFVSFRIGSRMLIKIRGKYCF